MSKHEGGTVPTIDIRHLLVRLLEKKKHMSSRKSRRNKTTDFENGLASEPSQGDSLVRRIFGWVFWRRPNQIVSFLLAGGANSKISVAFC